MWSTYNYCRDIFDLFNTRLTGVFLFSYSFSREQFDEAEASPVTLVLIAKTGILKNLESVGLARMLDQEREYKYE